MTAPVTLASTSALASGLSALRGVAVASGSLYWTSSHLGAATVQKATVAGTGLQTVTTLGGSANPRGIAVYNGRLYITDFDQNQIESMNLDGTGLAAVITTGANSGAYGICVDPSLQRIYWTNYIAGEIWSCSLNGGSPTRLYFGLGNPTYLTLDPAAGNLYWIEARPGLQHLWRAPKGGGGSPTKLAVPVTSFGGLVFAPAGTANLPPPQPVYETLLAAITPNPSPGATAIDFELATDSQARLAVTDVQGRLVATLLDGMSAAGHHHVEWTGATRRERLPSGLYFVTLRVAGRELVRRLIVTR